MKKLTSNNGITLVISIITIIVLLILAMVVIRAVIGDGIITKATKAQKDYSSSKVAEDVQIDLNEWKTLKATEGKELGIYLTESGKYTNVTGDNNTGYTVTKDGYTIQISAEGKVTDVNQYEVGLEIGTYVKYGVSYTDMYTGYDFTTEEGRGWRVLDPGTYNRNGTYSNVKLISTGIPANLYYHYGSISRVPWKGTDSQISDYTSEFYASSSATNYNMYAATGLYYNFGKIVFNHGTSAEKQNTGYFTKINEKTDGSLTLESDSTKSEFITENATEVHNLTMYELNQARNKKVGTEELFALNQIDAEGNTYSSSYRDVITENDAATGLFYLSELNKYGYTSSNSSSKYWLASPNSGSTFRVWYVLSDGKFSDSYSSTFGVRPVVCLKSNIKMTYDSTNEYWTLQ